LAEEEGSEGRAKAGLTANHSTTGSPDYELTYGYATRDIPPRSVLIAVIEATEASPKPPPQLS